MSTIVLFWNPEISSYTMSEHREMLADNVIMDRGLNWSVWENQFAHEGDRFIMVRCKNKPVPGKLNQWGKQLWEPEINDRTGICMAGIIISEPYRDKDWSGKGRETFYVDLDIEYATDPDKFVMLKTADLIAAIPNFDWKGGHSGRLLDDAFAAKLQELLDKSISENSDKIWEPEVYVEEPEMYIEEDDIIVNGNEKCSDFGNKTAVDSATMMQ